MPSFTMSPTAPNLTHANTDEGKVLTLTITDSASDSGDIATAVQGGATWLVPPAVVNHGVPFNVRINPKLFPGGVAKLSSGAITGVIRFSKATYTDLDVTFTLLRKPGGLGSRSKP